MRTLILLLLCLVTSASVQARYAGSISGNVTNTNSKPLSGATITLFHAGSAALKTHTNTNGQYKLDGLAAGNYEVRISLAGYGSQRYVAVSLASERLPLLLHVVLQKEQKWGSEEWVKMYHPALRLVDGPETKAPAGSKGRSGSMKEVTITTRRYASPGRPAMAVTEERMSSPSIAADDDIRPFRGSAYNAVEGSVASESRTMKWEMEKKPGDAKADVSAPAGPAPRPGLLTSGEINDFSKWTLWQDVGATDLQSYQKIWSYYPQNRYTVVMKSRDGKPLCNARVRVNRAGDKAPVWEAVTDNTGKAELWSHMFGGNNDPEPTVADVTYGGQTYTINNLKAFGEGANIINTRQSCSAPDKLDIAFIVDATGSMGDEINYLKEELKDILEKVKDSLPGLRVQTGCVFYRDKDDEYLARISDLKPEFSQTLDFIRDNVADGGGDTPEAVEVALQQALDNLHWREDAVARIAFLILDAPPHNDSATVQHMKDVTYQYAKRGIRLVPVVCSGADKSTEYLMRSLALATNGTYLFLTDHSGIGGSHLAPTTDKFDVEYLNGLIYKVIYQFSYMPPCKDEAAIKPDTSTVLQQIPTDSIHNDTVQTAALQWKYYPNPTTGILYIEHQNTPGDLFICDISGKIILRYNAALSGVTTVDVANYPSGVYFIRYQYRPDKWVEGKFVVVH